jgi:F0F1-type ATP synthase assembly protein I
MGKSDSKGQDEFRAAVTITLLWVAGLTLGLIFLALLAGLWLDKILNVKPLFTILFMLTSIPITIVLTFRVVKSATARIQPGPKKEELEEKSHSGENR